MAEKPSRRQPASDFNWQSHARCRGLPTEMFFASDGERGQLRAASEERAKRVCRSCPVQRDCLRYAVVSVEAWGVWGATTPRERALVIRGQPNQPTGHHPAEVWQDHSA
ncbi:WhiB family transcriptional regulator [Mycobacterium sp. 852002-51961_SCH5331710]|uniref:WhiB family transcriptional regulator n=1 Tax=Mycobacterium sp. 852002-51961_SCH5331710 TaxID=1834105 RepID=UPI001E5C1C32|nr:WhiB family transcriptional regulator [Mycobacterium sp. 852002-51961_SCH5331710]